MANLPLRPCTAPRCPALTRGGPCDRHKKERQKTQDIRRGTAQQRGYDHRWAKFSKAFLAEHPICGMRDADAYDGWRGECHERGLTTAAEVTDHIIPHKQDAVKFWDRRNHQAMCRRCNSLKAVRYEGGYGR